MPISRADPRELDAPHDGRWAVMLHPIVDTDLSDIVTAPTISRPTARPRPLLFEPPQDGRWAVMLPPIVDTELSEIVIAPTIGRAIGGDGAVVVAAAREGDERQPTDDRDGRVAFIAGVSAAEVAPIVRAPTVGGAGCREGARVVVAGADERD